MNEQIDPYSGNIAAPNSNNLPDVNWGTPDKMSNSNIFGSLHKAMPSVPPLQIAAMQDEYAKKDMQATGDPRSEELRNAGLAKESQPETFGSTLASSVLQQFHRSVADFQGGLGAMGVPVDFGGRIEHETRASSLESRAPIGNTAMEKFADDPWNAFAYYLGSGAVQAGMLVAPSIALAVLAPELGAGLAADRLYKVASTGKKIVDGVIKPVAVGYAERSLALTQAAALKAAISSPLTASYVAMTISPYADEVYKTANGSLSYSQALGWAALRSIGEGIIEGVGMGGRLVEKASEAAMQRNRAILASAIGKRIAPNGIRQGEENLIESFGAQLMQRFAKPLYAGPSWGINYAFSALNDPMQEAVQEFYGQLVNTQATGQDQMDPKAWADSFVAILPLSLLTGFMHASIDTRRQMADAAHKATTPEEMQKLQEAVGKEAWNQMIEQPWFRFADAVIKQVQANKAKGSGALWSADVDVVMSVLQGFKGTAAKLWASSAGKTDPNTIFSNLIPVLTSLDTSSMSDLLDAMREVQATDLITDPSQKKLAVEKANSRYTEVAKRIGLYDQVASIADQMKIADLEHLAKMAEQDANFVKNNTLPTIEQAKTKISDKAKQDGTSTDKTIASIIGDKLSALINSTDNSDIAYLSNIVMLTMSGDGGVTYRTIKSISEASNGSIESFKILLSNYMLEKNIKPSMVDPNKVLILKNTRVTLKKLGYNESDIWQMSPQKALDIVKEGAKKVVEVGSEPKEGEAKKNPDQEEASAKAAIIDRRPNKHTIPTLTDDIVLEIADIVNREGLSNRQLYYKGALRDSVVLAAILKSGREDVINKTPKEKFNAQDKEKIESAINDLSSIKTVKDLNNVEPGAVFTTGEDGQLTTVFVSALPPDSSVEAKASEARLRSEEAVARTEFMKNQHEDNRRNYVKSKMRTKVLLAMADVMDVFIDPVQAKRVESVITEKEGPISEDVKMSSGEIVLSNMVEAFESFMFGGGRGKVSRFDLDNEDYKIPPNATNEQIQQVEDRIESDINEALDDYIPRVKSAYVAWYKLTESGFDMKTPSSINANSKATPYLILKDDGTKEWVYPETPKVKVEKLDANNPFKKFMNEFMDSIMGAVVGLISNNPRLFTRDIIKEAKFYRDNVNKEITYGGIINYLTTDKRGSWKLMNQDLPSAVFATMPETLVRLALDSNETVTEDNFARLLLGEVKVERDRHGNEKRIISNSSVIFHILDTLRHRLRTDEGMISLSAVDEHKENIREAISMADESDAGELLAAFIGGMEKDAPMVVRVINQDTGKEEEHVVSESDAVDQETDNLPEADESDSDAEITDIVDRNTKIITDDSDSQVLSRLSAEKQERIEALRLLVSEALENPPAYWTKAQSDMAELLDVYLNDRTKDGAVKLLNLLSGGDWMGKLSKQEKTNRSFFFIRAKEKRVRGGWINMSPEYDEFVKREVFKKSLSVEQKRVVNIIDSLFTPQEMTQARNRFRNKNKFTGDDYSNVHGNVAGQSVAGVYFIINAKGNKENRTNALVLLNDATPETLMHEFMHHLMADGIMPKQYQNLLRSAYGDDEEAIADAMSIYLQTGITDEQAKNNPDLIAARNYVKSVIGITGTSLNGWMNPKSKKFFDVFIGESSVVTPAQAANARELTMYFLNSNAQKTIVEERTDNNSSAIDNVPNQGSNTPVNGEPQYKTSVLGTPNTLPVYSVSELISLISKDDMSGDKNKAASEAPLSVRLHDGRVVAINIDGTRMNDESVLSIVYKLTEAGFSPNKINVHYTAGVVVNGSKIDTDKIPLNENGMPILDKDMFFGDRPDSPAIEEYMSNNPAKFVATMKIGGVLYRILGEVGKKLNSWKAQNSFDVNKEGVVVLFHDGEATWKSGQRYVTDAKNITVIVNPEMISKKDAVKLSSLNNTDGVTVMIADSKNTLMPVDEYLATKYNPEGVVKGSVQQKGRVPYPPGEFFGFVDRNGYVKIKERKFYDDNHYILFGSEALQNKARFRYDSKTGKVNWLNNPSIFEKQMMAEEARTLLKRPNIALDHIAIDDGLYFTNSKGSISSESDAIIDKFNYQDSNYVKLSDVINKDSSPELSLLKDATITFEVDSNSPGVSYDGETGVITVRTGAGIGRLEVNRMVEYGLRLAHWSEISNDIAENNKNASDGNFSLPEFNEMGLITTSDFLLSNPRASLFNIDTPMFSPSAKKPKTMSAFNKAYERFHKAERLFHLYFAENDKEGNKPTPKQRAERREMIGRMTFGELFNSKYINIKELRKMSGAADILSKMTETILRQMEIDVNDPLEFKVPPGLKIRDAKEAYKIINDAVYQISRYKTLKDLNASSVGGTSIWEAAKRKVARTASYASSRTMSMWGIAKFLDHGDPDGVFTKMVRDYIVPALQRAKAFESDYYKDMWSELERQFEDAPDLKDEDGLIDWKLGDTYELDGKVFSGSEVIGLYMATDGGFVGKITEEGKDKGKYISLATRKVMASSSKLTDKMILEAKEIVENDRSINRFYKAIKNMFNEKWEPLNEVHKQLNQGKGIGKMQQNYFPMMWNFAEEETKVSSDFFEFNKHEGQRDAVQDPSMTHERSEKSGIRQTMPMFDAWEVLRVYHNHANNYIAKAYNTKMVLEIVTDPNIRKLVSEKFVNNALLNSFIEMVKREMTLTGRTEKYSELDRKFAEFRVRASRAALVVNPSPIMKQWSSFFPAMTMLPMRSIPILISRMIQGYAKAIAFQTTRSAKKIRGGESRAELAWSGNTKFAEMLNKVPSLRKRVIDQSLILLDKQAVWEGFSGRSVKGTKKLKTALFERGPGLLKLTDSGICFAIYQTAYEAELSRLANEGQMSEDQAETKAVQFATEVIRQANDPSSFTEMSLMQTGSGEMVKAGLQFSGFLFKQYQMSAEKVMYPAVLAYMNKDGGELSRIMAGAGAMAHQHRVFLWTCVFPALAMGSMIRGGPPDDKEDAFIDIMAYNFSALPLIGQYMSRGLQGSKGALYSAMWVDTGTKLADAVLNGVMAIGGREQFKTWENTKNLSIALAGFTGFSMYSTRIISRLAEYVNGGGTKGDVLEALRYLYRGKTQEAEERMAQLDRIRQFRIENKGMFNTDMASKNI